MIPQTPVRTVDYHKVSRLRLQRPDGEIGRRSGLKIRRPQGHRGSSPLPGTNKTKDLEELRPPDPGGHFRLVAVLVAVGSHCMAGRNIGGF